MELEKEQELFEKKEKWYAESGKLEALKILVRKEMVKNQHSQAKPAETCVIKLPDVLEFTDPIYSWALSSL